MLVPCLVAVILVFALSLSQPPVYTEAEVTAELAQIRVELPLARAHWESHHITSYDINVTGGIPLACLFNVTLQVRGGELATVMEENMAGQAATRPFGEDSICSYHPMLIPVMFEQVEASLAQIDPAEMYLLVEFDPVYGFVTDFHLGCRRQVSDCGRRFAFGGFRPVAATP